MKFVDSSFIHSSFFLVFVCLNVEHVTRPVASRSTFFLKVFLCVQNNEDTARTLLQANYVIKQ